MYALRWRSASSFGTVRRNAATALVASPLGTTGDTHIVIRVSSRTVLPAATHSLRRTSETSDKARPPANPPSPAPLRQPLQVAAQPQVHQRRQTQAVAVLRRRGEIP